MQKQQFANFRKQKGMSQQLLAKLSGVPRHRITQFECDYLVPTNEETKVLMSAIRKYKGASHGNSVSRK